MCANIQGKKINTKKDIQDLPTWGSCEKNFTAANFDILLRIEWIFFSHGIFSMKPSLCLLHVLKIPSPKDPQKFHIQNLATCVVVIKISLLTKVDTVPRIDSFVFVHENFGMKPSLCWLHVCQIWRPKYLHNKRFLKPTNMCSCEKHFTQPNFDTLPRIKFFIFAHEILDMRPSLFW